jgi:KAP family P-loop domain
LTASAGAADPPSLVPPRRPAASELIDDRSIATHEEDQLRHSGVARELESLILAVEPPANIALFGSWGSGKSGLAKLVCADLDDGKAVRCVTFDAFKYAENPLRRHFISQVSRAALGKRVPEFTDDLYHDSTETRFRLPLSKAWKVIGLFGVAVAVSIAVLVGIAAAAAALLPGEFSRQFRSIIGSGAVLLITPAALLAAFVALANKWIPIDRVARRPDSDEEFERLFELLVKKIGAKRLVIFVDELDRCSPEEVVTTLETIRTFLEVPGCVFVVAADQVALEKALSEKLRQSTPDNPVNPYYSAGSEYLDKVFGYQLSVPPLMPRRLTGYAIKLVAGREGVWQEIDHESVVPVLIPPHVRSPRRVKTLLNAFVASYRLADRRYDERVLHTAPAGRSAEIAKLVCLHHEFPLFARELTTDARFPEYVFLLPAVDGDELSPVERRHTRQLINYLQATQRVPGPQRDLIHLETGGEIFGLPEALADNLEELAVSRATEDVADLTADLAPEQQVASLRLLAQRSREAETIYEKSNVLHVMCSLAAALVVDSATPLGPVAGGLADALESYSAITGGMEEGMLRGAWEIGLAATPQAGRVLGEVLASRSADDRLDQRIIASSDQIASARNREKAGELLAHFLTQDAEATARALIDAPTRGAELVQAAAPHIQAEYRALGKSGEEETEEARAAREEGAEALRTSLVHVAVTLEESGIRDTAEAVVSALLGFSDLASRNAVADQLLSTFAPVRSDGLTAAVLRAASFRRAPNMAVWLAAIEPDRAMKVDEGAAVRSVANSLWQRLPSGPTSDDVKACLDALQRLRGERPWDRLDVELKIPATEDGDFSVVQRYFSNVEAFANAGVVDRTVVVEMRRSVVIEYLTNPLAAEHHDGAAAFLHEQLDKVAEQLGEHDLREIWELLNQQEWLPAEVAVRMRLAISATLLSDGANLEGGPTAEEVSEYIRTHGVSVSSEVARWLLAARPGKADLWAVIEASRPQIPPSVRSAVKEIAQELSPSARLDLARPLLDESPIDETLLDDLAFNEADMEDAAALIIDRYGEASNNQDRIQVLRIWKALRPADRGVRRRLIRAVLIPMAGENREALEIVLRELDLAREPPYGTLTDLRDSLREAGQRVSRAKEVTRRLEQMGWIERRGRLRRGHRDVGH